MRQRTIAEPYKIKVVEPLKVTTREQRHVRIQQAGYNTFLLRSEDVFIDLLTDSGTSAMSDAQWAGLMIGDEAYAGSRNFYHLQDAIRTVYGFEHVVPTHQGRAAEHLASVLRIRPGQVVPMNMFFVTTREHVERAGGVVYDCIIDEAHDPMSTHPFKGNTDIEKLDRLVSEVGSDAIAYLSLAPCVNMAGGQPFSMANLRCVSAWADAHGLPIILDATRAVENAYFIQQREPEYADKPVREILFEMMSFAESCTMSSKKDNLASIGGFLATRNDDFHEQARELVAVFEGLHTYGGMSGRDMEAVARGIHEMVDDRYIAARVGQVEYLGSRLREAGIPIVEPVGGHAIFIDALRFLPHVAPHAYPAQTLTAALYIDSGVRSMECGRVAAGRDPETGEERVPSLELVRLTIPRRVYTNLHMDVVAESFESLVDERATYSGLRIIREPKRLRFFGAHFEPL